MKFVANHLVAINNVATAEAMLLAECAGLDSRKVIEVVGPGAGGSRIFQMRAPMMAEGRYEPATMKVSIWKKDMEIIAEFVDQVGCTTPPVRADATHLLGSPVNGIWRSGYGSSLRGVEAADHS